MLEVKNENNSLPVVHSCALPEEVDLNSNSILKEETSFSKERMLPQPRSSLPTPALPPMATSHDCSKDHLKQQISAYTSQRESLSRDELSMPELSKDFLEGLEDWKLSSVDQALNTLYDEHSEKRLSHTLMSDFDLLDDSGDILEDTGLKINQTFPDFPRTSSPPEIFPKSAAANSFDSFDDAIPDVYPEPFYDLCEDTDEWLQGVLDDAYSSVNEKTDHGQVTPKTLKEVFVWAKL